MAQRAHKVPNRRVTVLFEIIVGSRTSNSFLYKSKRSSLESSDLSPESQQELPWKPCSFMENGYTHKSSKPFRRKQAPPVENRRLA